MTRRELVRYVAVLTGSSLVGAELFLSGCINKETQQAGNAFSAGDISFFDEVAETIIPRTDTPGAKDAEVGQFMASYAGNCYDEAELKTLREGIAKLDEASQKMNQTTFLKATNPQREQLLNALHEEALQYNETNETKKGVPPHYFTLMKQLVLTGFFTSKPGVTKVLRYMPVPGKYEGCIDYKEGETSWA